MTIKKISYKQKMKEIRSFVNFNYDLRKPLHPRQKGKIDKYWQQIQEAKGQAYRVFRTPNKNNLKRVQEATGFDLPDFKVAIIPNPDPDNPYKIKFKEKELIFSNATGDKYFIKFNINNLINPETHLQEIENTLAQATGDRIAIACGKFEYRERFQSKDRAKETIIEFIHTYGNPEAQNYFGNWLYGIYDIKIKNQKLMDVEMQKRAIYKTMSKKKRKEYLNKVK